MIANWKANGALWVDNCYIWCHSYSLSGLEWRLIEFIIVYPLVNMLLFHISCKRRQMATRTYILPFPVVLFITLFTVHLTNSLSCAHIRDWNRLPLFLIDHRVHKARRSSNDALSRVATHQLNKNMHMTVSWITLWWGKLCQLLFDI
jgi:hypothetical protein